MKSPTGSGSGNRFKRAKQISLLVTLLPLACERGPAWSGPLAARADSVTAGMTLTCVTDVSNLKDDLAFGDSVRLCRAVRGQDTAFVHASPKGRVRGFELFHVRARSALPALADQIVRQARGPTAHTLVGCPNRQTAGAWVWRDGTFDYEVEIETERNAVRESVWVGDSPMSSNCGRPRRRESLRSVR